MITKPMLASACKDTSKLDFKANLYIATPKLDGIRALKTENGLVSRTFKSIKNNHIRGILEVILPAGADGEIVCPGAFQKTTSGVMRVEGEPEFQFWWFDYVDTTDDEVDDGPMALEVPYFQRMLNLKDQYDALTPEQQKYIVPLVRKYKHDGLLMCIGVQSLEELEVYEQACIDAGYEGVILRTAGSPYKCGRATEKSQWLLKIKRFEDGEATIIGFGEKYHNDNPATKDAFGRTERSSHKANMRRADTLGNLLVKDLVTGVTFEIGTGFNDELRKEIWTHMDDWMDKIAKYKHFAVSGVKDKPRFPVYLGVRDPEDM